MRLEPASVRLSCIRPFTLSNMNIYETSCSIKIKFHVEHHWGRGGGGVHALGFVPDQNSGLVL